MLAVEAKFLLLIVNGRLLFLHFFKFWLDFHFLAVNTGIDALLACIEIAFLAIMKLISYFTAYLALAARMEMGQSQFVLIVACLEKDWLALEAKTDAVFITINAAKPNYFFFLAKATSIIPIFRPSDIG